MFSSQPQKLGQKIRLIPGREMRKRDRKGTGVVKDILIFQIPGGIGRDEIMQVALGT
jgi:hypothetical protein